ncbi:hypothetical protein M404DRAFT_30205 [Pisolithus tinctorius Marx 270]|uniref:Uncharacterized protein n=1 Tax=Pisolithus tinctorius Marx 270 TaxID=870435 RepID=A0A0C3NX38_PISTI|nr:hypothetical protein M404DRAFT_30205 [Pisolithus tinctorius Marx 270]
MIASYQLFVADPAIIGTIYHEVDEDSPLDLVYHTTIQALRLEELSHYVNHQNPLLSPARTILNEIAVQQVPLLLRLFDVLGGTNLIYNTAFGISCAELDYTLNIIETLAQLPPSPVLNAMTEFDRPLTPSDPRYCQTCYVCCHLGHIRVNCGLYECPLCHTTRPGHTQAQCPSLAPRRPLQERIATPGVVDDCTLVGSEDNDLYNNDFDFDDSAISNMTGEPYGE